MNVTAPVVTLAVRFGLAVPLAVRKEARSEALVPGPEPLDQLVPLPHVVLLLDVHVAFCACASGTNATPAARASKTAKRIRRRDVNGGLEFIGRDV